MDRSDEILKVLTEIRDAQREHLAEYRAYLAEYREITGRSVGLQEDAVARQKYATDLYKKVLVAGGILVVILLSLVAYLSRFFF